jgi:hypothetical protein
MWLATVFCSAVATSTGTASRVPNGWSSDPREHAAAEKVASNHNAITAPADHRRFNRVAPFQ